jgi:hypothetical protein
MVAMSHAEIPSRERTRNHHGDPVLAKFQSSEAERLSRVHHSAALWRILELSRAPLTKEPVFLSPTCTFRSCMAYINQEQIKQSVNLFNRRECMLYIYFIIQLPHYCKISSPDEDMNQFWFIKITVLVGAECILRGTDTNICLNHTCPV